MEKYIPYFDHDGKFNPYNILYVYRIYKFLSSLANTIYYSLVKIGVRKNIEKYKQILIDKELDEIVGGILFKNIESFVYNTLNEYVLNDSYSHIPKLHEILHPNIPKSDIIRTLEDKPISHFFIFGSGVINTITTIEKEYDISFSKFKYEDLSRLTAKQLVLVINYKIKNK